MRCATQKGTDVQNAIPSAASCWFIGGLLLAAGSDAWRMRIPNSLILSLLAGYAMTVAFVQPGWSDLLASLAVALGILAGGTVLFARGWMGGGDVKLLAVAGLWLGPAAATSLLLLTAVFGGVLTLSIMLARETGMSRLVGGHIPALSDPARRVPYGIAIAAAGLAVLLLQPEALVSG